VVLQHSFVRGLLNANVFLVMTWGTHIPFARSPRQLTF